jgi:hypothetical protein
MRELRTLRWLLVGLVLLVSGTADAVSFYGELKTATGVPFFSDRTGRATVDLDFDPFSFAWTASSSSPGLGSPLVGPTKTYTHTFAPGVPVAAVHGAWLLVSVIDDGDLSHEIATIAVDGALFDEGQATFNLFVGTVTASIGAAGDTIEVTVSALKGDFKLVASALKVKFSPIPEPTTGVLLTAGLAGLAWRSRRRGAAAAGRTQRADALAGAR